MNSEQKTDKFFASSSLMEFLSKSAAGSSCASPILIDCCRMCLRIGTCHFESFECTHWFLRRNQDLDLGRLFAEGPRAEEGDAAHWNFTSKRKDGEVKHYENWYGPTYSFGTHI